MTMPHRIPEFRSLTPPVVPGMPMRPPLPADKIEAELQAMGFTYGGDFDASMSPKVSMTLRAYLSPDREILASLISVASTKETRSVLDLSTSFTPRGSVSTTTSKDPDIFIKPSDCIVVKAPWKTSVAELLGLHVEVCALLARHQRAPAVIDPLYVRQVMIKNQANEFEDLCATGSFRKRGDGKYAMTPRTAFSAVNRLFARMIIGRFLPRRTKPDNLICLEVDQDLRQNLRGT